MDASQVRQHLTELHAARLRSANRPTKLSRRLRTVMHAGGLACASVAIVIFVRDIAAIRARSSRGIGKEVAGVTICVFSIIASAIKSVPKLDRKTRRAFPFSVLECLAFLVFTVASGNGGPGRSSNLGSKYTWVVTFILSIYWAVAAYIGYHDTHTFQQSPALPPPLVVASPYMSPFSLPPAYSPEPHYTRSRANSTIKNGLGNARVGVEPKRETEMTEPRVPAAARQRTIRHPNYPSAYTANATPFAPSTIFDTPRDARRRRKSSPDELQSPD